MKYLCVIHLHNSFNKKKLLLQKFRMHGTVTFWQAKLNFVHGNLLINVLDFWQLLYSFYAEEQNVTAKETNINITGPHTSYV